MRLFNINNKNYHIAQLSNAMTDEPYGLYLIPKYVDVELLADEFEGAKSQKDFDNNNSVGAIRIFGEEFRLMPDNF